MSVLFVGYHDKTPMFIIAGHPAFGHNEVVPIEQLAQHHVSLPAYKTYEQWLAMWPERKRRVA